MCQEKKLMEQGHGHQTCWGWDLRVKRVPGRRVSQHKGPEVGAYLAHVRKCKEAVWPERVEWEAVLWRLKSEK